MNDRLKITRLSNEIISKEITCGIYWESQLAGILAPSIAVKPHPVVIVYLSAYNPVIKSTNE